MLALVRSSGDTSHLNDSDAVYLDLAVHILAIGLALEALTYARDGPTVTYLTLVTAMFSFSAAYNISRVWWLRRLDHAAICVLAATTGYALLPPAPASIWFIVAGGSFYLAGMQFLLRPDIRYHNAVWHSFVIVAAACHYEALLI